MNQQLHPVDLKTHFTGREAELLSRTTVFAGPPAPCEYLPGRSAVRYCCAAAPLDAAGYEKLLGFGWRRSGMVLYRNRCPGCRECTPVKIPVAAFSPDRSQLRTIRKNSDLAITFDDSFTFRRQEYELFADYSRLRHGHTPSPADYREFLCRSPYPGITFHYRCAGRLLGLAWCDVLPDSLSAVYCAYDTSEYARGLGVFSIVFECSCARDTGRSSLHLGFLVRNCRKMAYKNRYRPLLQCDFRGNWVPVS